MFPMMRDEFGSIDTPEAAEERGQQAPVGVGQALAATAGQTTGDIMRFVKHKLEPEPFFQEGEIKSPVQLNEQFGLKGEHQFKNYMNENTASEMVDALRKRQKSDEIYAKFSEQHGYLTRMATGFIGSMLDPVEASAMFVPGLGEERLAYKLATMGYGRQAVAFMSKAGAGASAGMAGAAALEPLKAVMSEEELHDWSVRDALTNVFMGAPAGALMHAGLVPGAHALASFAKVAKPEPYMRDYSFWDTDRTTPSEMALNVNRGVQRGVEGAFDQELNKQPPSFGHINELDRMNAIERHVFMSSSFAQLMTGKEVTAGHFLFPDHSVQARRLAPEAHAEWDKLQEELNSISAGHVWGEAPTPEQLNDPAWKLEQELREHTRNILPVSWDLRVATEGLTLPPGKGMASFGGELAQNYPSERLQAARELRDRGASREEIWGKTGWRHDVEGRWKFEIDDSKSHLDETKFSDDKSFPGITSFHGKLGDIFSHDELFEQYPQLKDVDVGLAIDKTIGELDSHGAAGNNRISITSYDINHLRQILLHEMQHIIQGHEFFAEGGNPELASGFKEFDDIFKYVLDKNDIPHDAYQFMHPLHEEFKKAKDEAIFQAYRRVSGETESRNVEERRDLTPEERKIYYPWLTQDIIDEGRIPTGMLHPDDARDVNALRVEAKSLMDQIDTLTEGKPSYLLSDEALNEYDRLTKQYGEKKQEIRNILEGAEMPSVYLPWLRKNASQNMFSFGGVKASKPPKGLKVAQEMEKRGHRKEDIWSDTGWHRGPTGGWRFEIDDSKSRIITGNLTKSKSGDRMSGTVPLNSVFTHPELYKQYPELQDLTTHISINPNSIRNEKGVHYPSPNRAGVSIHVDAHSIEGAQRILIHEIQHAIQNREGEVSPEYNKTDTAHLHPLYKEITKEIKNAVGSDKSKDWTMYTRFAIYQHMQKEIESRLVEERLGLDKEARADEPPFAGKDTFDPRIPQVVQDVVSKHLGTEIFDMKSYADYLRSPEHKARQDEISARKERIRSALDTLKAKPEAERVKANEAVEKEKARIEKAKADEAAARQRASEALARAEAIRAAEGEAARTEAQARKAQADLEKLEKEIQKAFEIEEKARQAAASAEENLRGANERLAEAESRYREAEQEHAKLSKELESLNDEIESTRAIIEAEERERLDAAKRREGETLVAQGMTDPAKRTAWISAMAVDPKLVAREESGHAIRHSGLFKQEEWSILRGKAINEGWLDDMPKEVQAKYEEVYADRGADGARDAMVEEAIMHRFAKGPEAWGPEGGVVSRFMHRIKELLERIGNWMTSRGFQSARDVFDAMENGKISARETLEAHPARRMSEIEARMEELKPTIIEAYNTAKANSPYDIPSIANMQRTRAKYGEAPAMPQDELTKVLEQLYGPKEEQKLTPAKPGEIPVELQIEEQRFQAMIEEGYEPDPDEIGEHLETQRALQEALAMEQGYQQAAECLITAGFK